MTSRGGHSRRVASPRTAHPLGVGDTTQDKPPRRILLERLILRHAPIILLTIGLTGCVSVKSEKRFVITQQAMVPAPTGPEATGTITRPGHVAVQGGAHYTHVTQADEPKDQAEFGHLLYDRTFTGRVSLGVSEHLELGLNGRYSNSRWAKPTSSITPEGLDEETRHSIWVGAQARGVLLGDRVRGFGYLGELSVGNVPFTRHVEVRETTSIAFDDNVFNGNEPSVTREYDYTEEENEVHAIARAGLIGFLGFDDALVLNAGVLAQQYPRYWARRVTGQVCEDYFYDEEPASCSGDTPETINSSNSIGFGTLFFGATIGGDDVPVSVHGQVYYHAFAPSLIKNVAPVGADVELRYTF